MHVSSELDIPVPDRLPLACSLARVVLLQKCEHREDHKDAKKGVAEIRAKIMYVV
jgi:hypothetical protein